MSDYWHHLEEEPVSEVTAEVDLTDIDQENYTALNLVKSYGLSNR